MASKVCRPFGLLSAITCLATGTASAADTCSPPVESAIRLLENIESKVRDPQDLSKIYGTVFTADFRRQLTEQEFIRSVQTGTLIAGSAKLPPLSKRVISASVDMDGRKNNWSANDQRQPVGTVVEVRLLSAGATGRVRQTVTMRCEGTWKVQGLEYEPVR